jgi:hypothetical protein
VDRPEESDKSQEESLAAVPLTPVDQANASIRSNLGLGAIMLTVAGAGALALISGSMTACMGATRSTKLEWERRKLEIERAQRNSVVNPPVDTRSDDQTSP